MEQLRNWWKEFKEFKERKLESRQPPIREQIIALFEKEKIPYRFISHSEAYTAPELAASIHIPGRKVAKVLLVWADGEYVMAVLASHHHLDLTQFAQVIRARQLLLAKEWEVGKLFPDCEIGAMPPLGNLYGLRVYVDMSLAVEPLIYFPAGSHHEVVEMHHEDFARLVHPRVGRFAHEPLKRAVGI
jgi:Ala-tRNA(Pro) deacylase